MPGVDIQGVMRAFVATYVKKGATQGGSSLTQQYVKNVLLLQAQEDNDPIAEYHASEETVARRAARKCSSPCRWRRRIRNWRFCRAISTSRSSAVAFTAWKWPRDDTSAPRPAKLGIVQARTTIAAITKNPAAFDPSVESNQKASQRERNIVLDLMYQEEYISQKQRDEAKAKPLKDTLKLQDAQAGCSASGDAAFFCDYVTKKILRLEGVRQDHRRAQEAAV